MRPVPAVLVDSAVWAVWGVAVGAAASRLPSARLAADNAVTRLRRFERGGRLYERLGIRRWKDRLPDAGTWFGGPGKRHVRGRSPAALSAFAAETRRAELVHWLVPAAVLAFPLWNPWEITAVMVVYAVAANAPCLLVQRYNRGRVLRVLAGRGREGVAAWRSPS